MIEKKVGVVNEIIYNNTVYNDGKNRMYPAIGDLIRILNLVCDAGETTEYIRVMPFYSNCKRNIQHEFEENMFYLECRISVSKNDVLEQISSCLGTEKINEEHKRIGAILYPLCQLNDVDAFVTSIKKYIEYLDTMIPMLMDKVSQSYELRNQDIGFGYFSFEVHSG